MIGRTSEEYKHEIQKMIERKGDSVGEEVCKRHRAGVQGKLEYLQNLEITL